MFARYRICCELCAAGGYLLSSVQSLFFSILGSEIQNSQMTTRSDRMIG
jgi:hypothetical protein